MDFGTCALAIMALMAAGIMVGSWSMRKSWRKVPISPSVAWRDGGSGSAFAGTDEAGGRAFIEKEDMYL